MSMTTDSGGGRPVPGLDGPTLRAVRESIKVPLRRIARQAGMSHGHLSKVERGEHGRPVTPAILSAYERVTGVKLHEAAEHVRDQRDRDTGRPGRRTWTPGEMTDLRRRGYNAAIGAIGIDGHLGEPVGRLIDSTGRAVTPAAPDELDRAQLQHTADLLTSMDMRYGGGLVYQLAKAVLRWAVSMLDAYGIEEPQRRRLHATIGQIAHRAGWAGFDTGAHEAARGLFRLALYNAAAGEDHDLRGHVLADVAAQHNQVGYPQDALKIIRSGEGDERIAPAVRAVLHGAKARVYGCLGDADACHGQIQAAQDAFAQASPEQPGWVGRLAHPARLPALAGQALAELAARTGDEGDRKEAADRLEQAIDAFDPQAHARARGLCVARFGLLMATSGDPQQAETWPAWIREKLPPGQQIRSGRLGLVTETLECDAPADGDDDADS